MRALTAKEFAADFPDDELIVYRNHVFDVECLIRVPRAKLAEIERQRAEAERLGRPLPPLPLWRHGGVIEVRDGAGQPPGIRPVV